MPVQGTPQDHGVVQRTLQQIFAHMESQPEREFLLAVSILEIYNEVCTSPSMQAQLCRSMQTMYGQGTASTWLQMLCYQLTALSTAAPCLTSQGLVRA